MKLNYYYISGALSALTLMSGCGGDGKSYPFEGKYELTTASCSDTMADMRASDSVNSASSMLSNMEISGSTLKFTEVVDGCTLTFSFDIKSADNGKMQISGGKFSTSGGGANCPDVKANLKQETTANYVYNDPILALTDSAAADCGVYRKLGTKSGTRSTASTSGAGTGFGFGGAPSSTTSSSSSTDLASWYGTYVASTTDSCRYITDDSSYSSAYSNARPGSLKSVSLSSSSVTLLTVGNDDYNTNYSSDNNQRCQATISFPVSSSTSARLNYSSPTVSASPVSSASTSTHCYNLELNTRSYLANFSSYRSNYNASSTRLEFTDPSNGKCMVLTRQ